MKILNCILTLGCLSGMVSCYPVVANQNGSNAQNKKVSTSAPVVEAKKKSVPKKKKKKPSYTDVTTPDYGASTTSAAGSSSSSDAASSGTSKPNTGSVTNKPVVKEKKKPVAPISVKTARKVPGRDGFVFNPYTLNQVDVRGIPSGTKVRDPHDSNPSHVFRVP